MKTRDWKQQFAQLNKPGFYLLLVFVAGIAANAMIAGYKLLPLLHERLIVRTQLLQAEARLKAAENIPIPVKATDSMIEEAVKQVPAKEEMPRFILSLKELEQKTGIVLKSIRLSDSKAEEDQLMAVINGQKKFNYTLPDQQNETSAATNAPSAANQQPQGQGNLPASTAVNGFQETKVTVIGTGTYAQAVQFFNEVHRLERIVSIHNWSLEPTGKTNAVFPANPGEPIIQITADLSIYHALQYAGKFPDLPEIPLNPFIPKQSPMIADDQFLRQLELYINSK